MRQQPGAPPRCGAWQNNWEDCTATYSLNSTKTWFDNVKADMLHCHVLIRAKPRVGITSFAQSVSSWDMCETCVNSFLSNKRTRDTRKYGNCLDP